MNRSARVFSVLLGVSLRASVGVAIVASLAGCRGGGPLNEDPYKQNMVEGALDSGPVKYRAEGASFARYTEVVIDMPTVDPDATQGDDVSADQLEKLRAKFAGDLRAAFGNKYKVVARAGVDSAFVVRAAIVRAVPNKPMRNFIPTTQVGRTGYGYASVRVELCDATTGAQLASLTDTRSTKRVGIDKLSEWGSVEKSFEVWAADAVEIAK